MKWIGSILVAVSLATGALAAATAYLAPLDLPDEQLVGLTLNAPAGGTVAPGGEPRPLADKGASLNRALVAQLRDAGVRYVIVREFLGKQGLPRWPGKWAFVASLVGLTVGAGLMRHSTRRTLAAAVAMEGTASPSQALAAVRHEVEQLRSEVAGIVNRRRQQETIVSRLTHLQQTHMLALVEARPRFIARLGMAGFATLMDGYAAAERQINRAWSAAADGISDEAHACLAEASRILDETQRALES